MSVPSVTVAWCKFQPRTIALAAEFDGKPYFLDGGWVRRVRPLLPLRYVRDAVVMWRLLNRERPELVLAISPPVFCPIIAWLWGALHGRPVAFDWHTDVFDSPKWLWSLPIHRWLARRVKAVSVHTAEAEVEVQAWGAPGLLLPDDVPGPDQAEPQPAPASVCVLIAGGLDAQEPVESTLEAARLLPEVEFRLTGDPDRVALPVRQKAPDNAIFTGWLDYPRFLGEVHVANVVAAFSTNPRIMNRAAFEAIGLERPLVLTDFQGLRRRFGDAPLYTDNDPQAMADSLQWALAHEQDLAERSRQFKTQLKQQHADALGRMKAMIGLG